MRKTPTSLDLSFFRSETSQRLRGDGRIGGVAESILEVLAARSIVVSPEDHTRIVDCADREIPDSWRHVR